MSRSSRKKQKQNNQSVPFGIRHIAKQPKYKRDDKFDEELLNTILKHPDNEKYQHEFTKFIFEPILWGKYHNQYKTKFQPSKIKGMRILIQISTISSILRGKYFVYNNENDVKDANDETEESKEKKENVKMIEISKKSIIESVNKTVLHLEKELFVKDFFDRMESKPNANKEPKILLFNEDILDVGKYVINKYHIKPLILVMSSRGHPGGGYKIGAGAQEEDLCRRSTLFCNLEDPYNYRKYKDSIDPNNIFDPYPLPEFGGIYSKNVIVFRNGANKNYSFYNRPLKMSFVSVYSYSSPNINQDNKLSKTMEKRTIKKIETIFRIAMKHNHKCVILSAFGSGCYENPPKHIAQLFKLVINKKEYKQFFDLIIFAILNDKNTGKSHNPKGNVIPYSQVFETDILNLDNH